MTHAPAATGTGRALVVSLHDVSPFTHAECAGILDELRSLGIAHTSLLVVPNHHHRGHMRDHPAFVAWLREQAAAGHEVIIHGYYHQRHRRPGENLFARLTTRFYTADEGEFYDLDRPTALALVSKAETEFRELGLASAGFIAPAWLLSAPAEDALRELHYEYTTRLGSVLDLCTGHIYRSQSLVWSVRSGWRRQMSLAWSSFLHRRLVASPLLRLSIHPVDFQHTAIWQQIRELVTRALADREPLTYLAWVQRQRAATPP